MWARARQRRIPAAGRASEGISFIEGARCVQDFDSGGGEGPVLQEPSPQDTHALRCLLPTARRGPLPASSGAGGHAHPRGAVPACSPGWGLGTALHLGGGGGVGEGRGQFPTNLGGAPGKASAARWMGCRHQEPRPRPARHHAARASGPGGQVLPSDALSVIWIFHSKSALSLGGGRGKGRAEGGRKICLF